MYRALVCLNRVAILLSPLASVISQPTVEDSGEVTIWEGG